MEISIPERAQLSRREWVGRLLQVAGAGFVALPLLAEEHQHGTGMSLPAAEGAWKPAFLSSHQNSSLVALGEGILPGSREAMCNRVIDLVLNIESEKNKSDFSNALNAFEMASQERYGHGLTELSAGDLNALLTSASEAAHPLAPHFELIKEWLADTYWSSRQGLKELGWTGRVAWSSYDGCPHPGGHA